MTAPDRQRVVGNLQALRLIAAAMVVVGHLDHEAIDQGFAAVRRLPYFWSFGVDLFFVISGFVMYLTSAAAFGRPGAAGAFLRRRIERIVPIYWLFTLLMLAAAMVAGPAMRHRVFDPGHVAASFLFLPVPNPAGEMRPVLSLGWTLEYEMLFYLLFAVALLLPRRRGLAALAAAFLTLVAIHPLLPPAQATLRFWTAPIILEFLGGIGIAMLHARGVRLAGWPVLAALAGGAALIGVTGALARVPMAIGIAGLVALAREPSYQGRAGRLALLGGDASYALYLSHPFAITLIALPLRGSGWAAFVVIGLAAALAVGVAVHLLVERPLLRWLRGARDRPEPHERAT